MKFRRQLFKYIDVNGALAMLSKGTLQFTNSFYFNDPFDCHPSLIDFSSSPSGLYGPEFTNMILKHTRINMIGFAKGPGYVVCPR